MRVTGTSERDSRDLAAYDQDTGTLVVLSQVLGNAEDGAAAIASDLVEHEALDRATEAEELSERPIGTRHVDPGSGAEDKMGDLRFGLAPLLDGPRRCLLGELGHLDHHDVLAHVQRLLPVTADARVGMKDLLIQVEVPLRDARLLACSSSNIHGCLSFQWHILIMKLAAVYDSGGEDGGS